MSLYNVMCSFKSNHNSIDGFIRKEMNHYMQLLTKRIKFISSKEVTLHKCFLYRKLLGNISKLEVIHFLQQDIKGLISEL